MGKRKHIGLFFSYDENWIGGSYYIINLIESLKLLPENIRPYLTIFYYTDGDMNSIQNLHYPDIIFEKVKNNNQLIKRGIRFLCKKIFKQKVFLPQLNKKVTVKYYDAIFPIPFGFDDRLSKKNIHWIPDFQEIYLPHLFAKKQLDFRKRWQNAIASTSDTLVLSSYDAQKDFIRLYPHSLVKQKILQFAVTHQPYETIDFKSLEKKYGLPDKYFFCPNQFWVHKNQKVVLEAISILKNNFDSNIKIIFSGKMHDHRNVTYVDDLMKYVNESAIEDNVSFLGFIDRQEQLLIMKNAEAIIQPSLFEGWSTVVEDAKAMNQNIIASNIAVHKEQLGINATYFDPNDSSSLVSALSSFKRKDFDFSYNELRLKFAYNFLEILNDN